MARSKTRLLYFTILVITLWTANTHAKEETLMEDPLTVSRQALVVIAKDWKTSAASLQRYERSGLEASWVPVGEALPAMVGRNGLAWGNGRHGAIPADEPRKKEGDGKAPAGIFRLSSAFGYAAPETMASVQLPYRQATPTLLCVDDTNSRYYNRMIDKKQVTTDWKSCEEMRRPDNQYRMGIVIDHNTDPVVPGDGSCIFLHIWSAPGKATSGCTALAAENVEGLLHWLDPQANPVLIQLPASVYSRYRKDWNLP